MGRNSKEGQGRKGYVVPEHTKCSPHEYLSQAVERPSEQAATGISISKKKKAKKEKKTLHGYSAPGL